MFLSLSIDLAIPVIQNIHRKLPGEKRGKTVQYVFCYSTSTSTRVVMLIDIKIRLT
jgi:hypothetical protein